MTAEKRCFIVGAGSFNGMIIRPEASDFVIAADGGYLHLKREGIEPHVLIGDFDSLELIPEHHHLIRHSPIKDDTDMALAIEYGIAQGYDSFYIYGGMGGRLDHTIANIQMLTGISQRGFRAYLIGEKQILTTLTDGWLRFCGRETGVISVFCQGDQAKGVTETGLKYSLDHAVLKGNRCLGVSNEFTGKPAYIEVQSGTLLVLWDEKNGIPERGRNHGTEKKYEA